MQRLSCLSKSTKTEQMKDFIFTTWFNAYIIMFYVVEEIIIKYESRVKVLGQGVWIFMYLWKYSMYVIYAHIWEMLYGKSL